jgi:hypothetical protein
MRTQINKTEKITKKFKISVSNINPLPPTTVVLTLTSFERIGGET